MDSPHHPPAPAGSGALTAPPSSNRHRHLLHVRATTETRVGRHSDIGEACILDSQVGDPDETLMFQNTAISFQFPSRNLEGRHRRPMRTASSTTNFDTAPSKRSFRHTFSDGAMNPKKTTKEYITTSLNDSSVIFGRGNPSVQHIGNIRFRQLVQNYKGRYRSAKKRYQKEIIAREVVMAVKQRGGKFLRKIESLVEAESLGLVPGVTAWMEVDDALAIDKAKQSLRDRQTDYNHGTTLNKDEKVQGRAERVSGFAKPQVHDKVPHHEEYLTHHLDDHRRSQQDSIALNKSLPQMKTKSSDSEEVDCYSAAICNDVREKPFSMTRDFIAMSSSHNFDLKNALLRGTLLDQDRRQTQEARQCTRPRTPLESFEGSKAQLPAYLPRGESLRDDRHKKRCFHRQDQEKEKLLSHKLLTESAQSKTLEGTTQKIGAQPAMLPEVLVRGSDNDRILANHVTHERWFNPLGVEHDGSWLGTQAHQSEVPCDQSRNHLARAMTGEGYVGTDLQRWNNLSLLLNSDWSDNLRFVHNQHTQDFPREANDVVDRLGEQLFDEYKRRLTKTNVLASVFAASHASFHQAAVAGDATFNQLMHSSGSGLALSYQSNLVGGLNGAVIDVQVPSLVQFAKHLRSVSDLVHVYSTSDTSTTLSNNGTQRTTK